MSKSRAMATIALTMAMLGFLSVDSLAEKTESREPADANTYLADVSAQLRNKWPTNRVVNVVCHGHSVPAGYFKTPVVDSPNAYPHLLFMGLKERFPYAVINIIVTATGGETSDAGSARFEKDVLTHNPDVVTIDYGLNDRRLGLEKTRANLVSMIEKAKSRSIPVILLTPTSDISAKLNDPSDPLNQQAELIRTLAGEYHIGLVDSLAEFNSAINSGTTLDQLLSQGNHPNRRGHELVAKRLLGWFPK